MTQDCHRDGLTAEANSDEFPIGFDVLSRNEHQKIGPHRYER